ncbi:43202_t:CDS:2, partial [Gigaspora margarita]
KKPTIPEVPELCYTLESPEENNAINQELEEEKMKCINETNKTEIKKVKTKTYKLHQEFDDTLNIKWNLKSISGISCHSNEDLERNNKSTKDIKDNTPIEEGY